MHGRKPIGAGDLRYLYDGSLRGFYCCVYESVYSRSLPLDIQPEQQAQPSLLPDLWVPADLGRAERVRNGIRGKISPRALELVETVFFSCLPQKELHTLRFLHLAFSVGSKALQMLDHPDVSPLMKAEYHLMRERHLLTGFIRFSDSEGKLLAEIHPKNFVLPFLADHFIDRYTHEDFMIHDKTHDAALIYENRRSQIVQLENPTEFRVSAEEERYRALWKQFYKTLSIEARYNPKCRMTHMPKRYWADMLEVREELSAPT